MIQKQRFEAAKAAMQGILSGPIGFSIVEQHGSEARKMIAALATGYADALLMELSKPTEATDS